MECRVRPEQERMPCALLVLVLHGVRRPPFAGESQMYRDRQQPATRLCLVVVCWQGKVISDVLVR